MRTRRKTPPALAQLRSRFKTALAEAGLTMAAWADLNDWSRAHVVLVLAGDRESDRVLDAVREFTVGQEDRMRKRLAIAS